MDDTLCINSLALAYLGDSIYEFYVRKSLIRKGILKVNELQKELKDLDKEKVLKIAKSKAVKIQKKADELYKLAVEKGTPVVEKSVSELKQATADALKKIVAKLEEENK